MSSSQHWCWVHTLWYLRTENYFQMESQHSIAKSGYTCLSDRVACALTQEITFTIICQHNITVFGVVPLPFLFGNVWENWWNFVILEMSTSQHCFEDCSQIKKVKRKRKNIKNMESQRNQQLRGLYPITFRLDRICKIFRRTCLQSSRGWGCVKFANKNSDQLSRQIRQC